MKVHPDLKTKTKHDVTKERTLYSSKRHKEWPKPKCFNFAIKFLNQ